MTKLNFKNTENIIAGDLKRKIYVGLKIAFAILAIAGTILGGLGL